MTYTALPTTDKCNLLRSLIEKIEGCNKEPKPENPALIMRWSRRRWLLTLRTLQYRNMLASMKQLQLALEDYNAGSEQFCREINQISDEIEQTL